MEIFLITLFFGASIHQFFNTNKKDQTYGTQVTSEILTSYRRILSSRILCLFSISTCDRSSMIIFLESDTTGSVESKYAHDGFKNIKSVAIKRHSKHKCYVSSFPSVTSNVENLV